MRSPFFLGRIAAIRRDRCHLRCQKLVLHHQDTVVLGPGKQDFDVILKGLPGWNGLNIFRAP